MSTWLVALLAAVIGAAAAWAFAVGDRFFRARREVVENDRVLAEHDEDLASWVSDRHLNLSREIRDIVNELNERNLFYSGELGYQLALAKEKALHEYRDELRRVNRTVTARRESEGRFHRYWRRKDHRPFPTLTTPQRAALVLEAWRKPITRHGGTSEVIDPTVRDLDHALHDLSTHGSSRYE